MSCLFQVSSLVTATWEALASPLLPPPLPRPSPTDCRGTFNGAPRTQICPMNITDGIQMTFVSSILNIQYFSTSPLKLSSILVPTDAFCLVIAELMVYFSSAMDAEIGNSSPDYGLIEADRVDDGYSILHVLDYPEINRFCLPLRNVNLVRLLSGSLTLCPVSTVV